MFRVGKTAEYSMSGGVGPIVLDVGLTDYNSILVYPFCINTLGSNVQYIIHVGLLFSV